jgi:NAD(P)-dependent dehydrogenase (short-subunit alcohol dehydrogenase family)
MPGRLEGKVAVITGSSSGIGRATSLTFAREGASIVCSDLKETARQEAESEPTHELIKKNGGKVIFVKCDTSKEAEVEALLKAGVKEFGRVDIMVNNAGVALETAKGPLAIWEVDEERWDATMAVNAKGVMFGCKHAARVMMNQEPHPSGDRGWIINLASIFGLVGNPRIGGFCC